HQCGCDGVQHSPWDAPRQAGVHDGVAFRGKRAGPRAAGRRRRGKVAGGWARIGGCFRHLREPAVSIRRPVSIKQEDLIQSVADALQYISYYHPVDYIRNLSAAYEREESP